MKIGRSLIVLILQVFTDDGILMLLDAQVEVTARVAYIIRITRITLRSARRNYSDFSKESIQWELV